MTVPAASPGGASAGHDFELYKLAADEERRTLDLQRTRLDNVRARALQYLAFVGTSSAFLVGTSLGSESPRSGLFYAIASIGTVLSVTTIFAAYLIISARGLREADADGAKRWTWDRMVWDWGLAPGEVLQVARQHLPRTRAEHLAQMLAGEYSKAAVANLPNLRRMETLYSTFVVVSSAQLAVWLLLAWVKA